ncbi:MAG: NAD(P)/FAD-dependent oxidoreductase [Candidatus Cloacimonetes bacterium HGW-Cloacimonetes-1]|nr:MAG: NAD(P)/FAD-dependent oxidoreductase [Candidatus Cloacimonetes bacterium HGW-Cloacimonetes-1]
MNNPLLVIGSGPAGLAAAIAFGKGAMVLERNAMCGKKLLLSGTGQCNFTNDLAIPEFLEQCEPFARFLKPALYHWDNQAFISLLAEQGCPAKVREDGKVFPASFKSMDVRDTLLRIAEAHGATFLYNCVVTAVEHGSDGFSVQTNQGVLQSKQLVIAGGGKSYPQTGSDGSAYLLAESLGHQIVPLHPALAAIDVASYGFYKSCAGISLPQLRIKADKQLFTGDMLFTHKGLSGPVIINNSHHLRDGQELHLCLAIDPDKKILALISASPDRKLIKVLKALNLPEALLIAVLSTCQISPDTRAAELRAADRKRLSAYLDSALFIISHVESFATAMLTAGGVERSEVNPKTMESRLIPGLYFAGEVLDYNLPTGGFNIQMAFSTGHLAGAKAKKELLQ